MMAMARRIAGFSLLELAIAICVIAVLAFVALERMRDLQESAEEAAVERDLAALKAVVLVRAAELAAGSRWEDLQKLALSNPLPLLGGMLANNAGETASPPPGSWGYSAAEHRVLYRLRHEANFAGASPEMRFRLVVLDASGRLREGSGTGYVKLEPEGEYRWRDRIIR